MDELIARLEAATEGSRELDGDIAEAIGSYSIERASSSIWVAPQNAPDARFEHDPRLGKHWVWSSNCPHYSTSMDAALTLVPDGCFVTIDKYLVSDDRPDIWRAWVKWFPDDDASELSKTFSGLRSTLAHALAIAALKARQGATP